MRGFISPVENLIEKLCRLPGIGPKSAQRLAFYILSIPRDEAGELARAIVEVKEKVRHCVNCFNISTSEICSVCADENRDRGCICVVEEPKDLMAIEKSGSFNGVYHVLGGAISPIDGVGPEELRIAELLIRLKKPGIREVIIATNPNAEGEATAIYLARAIRALGIKVTRLASGLPVGGDLEYADEVTLGRALLGRTEMP